MKQFILSCVLSVAAIAPSQAQQTTRQLPVYLDQTKPVEQRIDDAISRMTLAEKIRIIHAQSKFSSAGVPRLGFPDFWTDDGPHGVRPDVLLSLIHISGRKLHHRCASHDWCDDVPQGHLEETRRMERRGVRPRSIHGAVEQAGIAMARGV